MKQYRLESGKPEKERDPDLSAGCCRRRGAPSDEESTVWSEIDDTVAERRPACSVYPLHDADV